MAQGEKKFDNAKRKKFTMMYDAKRLCNYHKLCIAPFFRRISKRVWSIQLYKISK